MSSKAHWIEMSNLYERQNEWLLGSLDESRRMQSYLRSECGWWAFGERGVANRCECEACNPIVPPVESVSFAALWEIRKSHSASLMKETSDG